MGNSKAAVILEEFAIEANDLRVGNAAGELFVKLGVLIGGDDENVGIELFESGNQTVIRRVVSAKAGGIGVTGTVEHASARHGPGSQRGDVGTHNQQQLMSSGNESSQHRLTDDEVPDIVRIADSDTHTVQTRIPCLCSEPPIDACCLHPLFDRRGRTVAGFRGDVELS